MLSRSVNGINWMEGGEELFSLTKNTEELGSLSNFMSMLEDDDWYLNNNYPSSSSSYPFHENQFQTNNNKDITFSSLLNAICTNNNPNPFQNSSNFGYNSEFLPPLHLNNKPQTPNSPHLFMDNNTTEEFLSGFTTNLSSLEQMGTSNLTSNEQFTHLTPLPESITNVFNPTSGFEDSGNSSFLNLCTDDDVGGRNLGLGFLDSNNGHGGFLTIKGKMEMGEEKEIDGSDLNYGSDEEGNENTCKVEDNTKNCNGSVKRGDHKGKKKNKKGLPAKNLMAERRRRKKLNDRLYMLRSIIPKISKMDRASILGDAIDYLKELLQRINGLNNELELSHSSSSLPSNLHPLTHPPMLPSRRVKEELCPSSLAGPNGQSTMVEVKVKEGRDVNIHMFCGCRPGLLFSTMKALDNLGLDIEQAVVSCFDGFSLDIFHAELPKEGNDILPEQIEAILVNSAGVHQRM